MHETQATVPILHIVRRRRYIEMVNGDDLANLVLVAGCEFLTF